MRERLDRRAFVARSVGAMVALSLGALANPRPSVAAWVAEPTGGPIPVRVGKLAQAGREFRGGDFQGVSLPGLGGTGTGLMAERPGAEFISEPLNTDFAASHVGLHWLTEGNLGPFTLRVRSSGDGQRWSSWRPIAIESHGRDLDQREAFGALVGVGRARWLQYRVTFQDASRGTIERVALTYLDAGVTPSARSQAMRTSARLGPADFLDRVISREAWGADESIRFNNGVDQWPRAFVTPKFMAVHHTATDNEYDDPAAEIRAIYTFHTVTQGFGDIGYHMLIDNRGQVYEGRRGREPDPTGQREIVSANIVAGHALGYNYGSVGIALLGLFREVEPTTAARDTLTDALTFEAHRHGLDPLVRTDFLRARGTVGANSLWRDELAVVSGHRDCVATECPGDQLYRQLPEIRSTVANRLGQRGDGARFTQGPPNRDVWPTDLVFGWEARNGAVEFSTRLEGFRPADVPDLIVPLSGYTEDEREAWSAWSRDTRASFALPPPAAGSYTFHIRARDARGRELPAHTRWPMFVDRHVLVDNRDAERTERVGSWQPSSEVLAFNGRDYEQSDQPVSFIWQLQAPESGTYRVLACWADSEGHTPQARYTISVPGEILASATVSQQERGALWNELAQIPLTLGSTCRVELTNHSTGLLIADAVRLVLVD